MNRKFLTKIFSAILFAIIFSFQNCDAASPAEKSVDYGRAENWAYLERDDSDKAVDVFFVCPTVFKGDETHLNMEIDDEETRPKFVGATNMEKGIYDKYARFFAPYYRMAGFSSRQLPGEGRAKCVEFAYQDVRKAFLHYLKNFNNGRPFILAGFSQGSQHVIHLLKEFGNKKSVKKKFIAAYCPGWFVTPEDIARYPHLKPARSEDDTGVIISYNTEAENVNESIIVPANVKTISINPLSWQTNFDKADKSLNRGACFTDYSGKIDKEIPHFTGAYIDRKRGTLKVTDVNPADYLNKLAHFAPGVYHIYDYQFFYRNLQENVLVRIEAFQNKSDK